MRYLITGHKGFIGTNLFNHLIEKGEKVVGIDRPSNICKLLPVDANIDIVIHLAAETDVRKSIRYPGIVFNDNCQSTQAALEMARFNDAKFVFASSCAAENPISPYGASKAAGEAICEAYRHSYNMDITILRLSNVYGPHSQFKNSVIANFIKNILNDIPLTINGDGEQTRDFIYVKDVVTSILYANSPFRNVGSGEVTSINNLVSMLSGLANKLLNKSVDVQYSDKIIGEITSVDPITTVQKIPLKDGLESTFKWFIKYEKAICNYCK